MKAVLILEDGTVFEGSGFGSPTRRVGEVVFNTGMVGYTESITDPSYRGQILVFTYPLIGNYGVPSFRLEEYGVPKYFESESPQVSGVVCREACEAPNHWASVRTLDDWLKDSNIPGISNIDTRKLTSLLRTKGVMMGAIEVSTSEVDKVRLLEKLKETKNYGQINFFEEVTVRRSERLGDYDRKIVLIDCGVKYGIIRNLLKRKWSVVRMPYDSTYLEIVRQKPKGVLISNGPGDPVTCESTVRTARSLINAGVPVFGVCLGAQVLGLAMGATTFKLKFGHRGQNKPCVDLETGRSYVTSQNHGYSVDLESARNAGFDSWFVNADDGTLEGLIHRTKPVLAVQFHPEASPGPNDTTYIFDRFLGTAEERRR